MCLLNKKKKNVKESEAKNMSRWKFIHENKKGRDLLYELVWKARDKQTNK